MHFNSEDDYRTGCRNASPCQQQSYKRSFGYVSTGDIQRPGKTPTKTREKGGGNRGNLGRNPASLKTEVKLTRRKGSVTTENDLHTVKQPLFILKY